MASRVREGFVEGAGARIYFKTLGRGAPLLLLHGGPGADHSDFLPALKPLARRHQLVLIDERGSGRSERLADPASYTLGLMVKDIECVREALATRRSGWCSDTPSVASSRRPMPCGIRSGCWVWCSPARARVPGASMRISATCAKRLPAALRSRLASCERAGIFQANGAYTRRYAAASAQAIAPYMYARTPPRRFKNPPPLGMEVLREMWVRRSDFHIDGNLKGFDFTKALARVRVPSLVVIGDRDLVSTSDRGRKPRTPCRGPLWSSWRSART